METHSRRVLHVLMAFVCILHPTFVAAVTTEFPESQQTITVTEAPFVDGFETTLNPICKSTAEVAFVLDSSGSVGADNFDKMKEFSQNVTVSLDAYYDKLNVTLISFNLHPTIQIHKDEFDKTKDVLAAMSTLVYTHGGTNTHEALDLMYSTGFHKHSDGAKIAIVVTDGASFEPTLTKAAALTAKQGGVIIFVVGVGDDVNTKELSFISSDPDDKFLYLLSNFSGLPEAVQNIIGLFPHISCVGKFTGYGTASTPAPTPRPEFTPTRPGTIVVETPSAAPVTDLQKTPTGKPATEPGQHATLIGAGTIAPRTPTAGPPGFVTGQTPSAAPGTVIGETPSAKPTLSPGETPTMFPGTKDFETPTPGPKHTTITEVPGFKTDTITVTEEPFTVTDVTGSFTGERTTVTEVGETLPPSPGTDAEVTPTPKPVKHTGQTPTAQPGTVTGQTPSARPETVIGETPSARPATVIGETPSAIPGTVIGETPSVRPGTVIGETPSARPGTVIGETPSVRPRTVIGETPSAKPGTVIGETPSAIPGTVIGETPSARPATVIGETPSARPGSVIGETPSARPGTVIGETPSARPATVIGETPSAIPGTLIGETPSAGPGPVIGETPSARPGTVTGPGYHTIGGPGTVAPGTPTAGPPGFVTGQTPSARPGTLIGETPSAIPGTLIGETPSAGPGPVIGETPSARPGTVTGPGYHTIGGPGTFAPGTPTAGPPGFVTGQTPSARPGTLIGETPSAKPTLSPGETPTMFPGTKDFETPTPGQTHTTITEVPGFKTDTITVTEEPFTVTGVTKNPVTVTEEPVTDVYKVVTEEPITVTEEPVTFVTDVVTEAPVIVTEEPVTDVSKVLTEEPITVTEEPVTFVTDVVTEAPVTVTAEPVTVVSHVVTDAPITVTEEPVTSAPDVVTEASTTVTEEPVTSATDVVTEAPTTVTEEPITITGVTQGFTDERVTAIGVTDSFTDTGETIGVSGQTGPSFTGTGTTPSAKPGTLSGTDTTTKEGSVTEPVVKYTASVITKETSTPAKVTGNHTPTATPQTKPAVSPTAKPATVHEKTPILHPVTVAAKTLNPHADKSSTTEAPTQTMTTQTPASITAAPISTEASTPPSTKPSTAKSTPTTTSPSTPSTTTQSTTTTTMETTSTTTGTTTTASCVAKIADVVFVVDASGSIGLANFQKIKEFIKNVINTFDIESRYTRVGLIEFSTYPHIEFKLNDHPNITELFEAVDNINYSGGGTSTSDALELMRQEGFDRERPQAPDIAIIITDGLSKYPSLTRAQAQLAKNEGINLFAIGIGNDTQTDELKAIASRNLFFEVGDFDTLSSLDLVIAHSTCGVNLPEATHTRSTEAPVTASHGCMDIASECDNYHRDTCSDYEPYARKNCAKKCGFCDGGSNETKECKDELSTCSQYGTSMCSLASQYDWVDSHCRKFCGFCGSKVDLTKTTAIPTTTTPGTTTESSCKDVIGNCKDYGGPSMCKTYGSWAVSNCAKYCGYCLVYETVTSVTVNKVKCPEWQLPVECTLDYSTGSCCPMPNCPNGFRLTVDRNLS